MTSWKIIKIKGEAEPWWFFPDWEKDITEEREFIEGQEAFAQFINIVKEHKYKFEQSKQKKSTVAFWNKDEKVFCEACDDDLQLYHGLILMENGRPKEFSEEEKRQLVEALAK